jgi:hypothetical protein
MVQPTDAQQCCVCRKFDSARRNASFCLILNQQNDILRWIPYTRLTSLFCKAGGSIAPAGRLEHA